MNDIIFPGSLWAIFQRSGCSLEAASVARTIHFSAGAAEGVGAAPHILLVLPPHIWATSPKAAPPPTLFNLRSERLSQRLYASSIWKTLFSSSSNVRLLFFEAGSF